MDKAAVLEIIELYRAALEARGTRVSRIVLFGSYSTGNHLEGSDIDLVVISEDFTGKGLWERIEILAKAICDVFEPIEAVAMTPEEWASGDSLVVDFAKDGEVVYGG